MLDNVYNEKKRVLLAMSGGVDSAAAALYLTEAGYNVTGVTFLMHGDGRVAEEFFAYKEGSASAKAKAVCDAIGIDHVTGDARLRFRECVTVPFVAAYGEGKTPNPCIICNRTVKFRLLLDAANEGGYDYIATGHYSRVCSLPGGRVTLSVATDTRKDQSYMLYTLPQSVLSRLILPLGDKNKPEVREYVTSHGFEVGGDADSQDICFIPDGDYAAYMERQGFVHEKGDFIDVEGKRVGTHGGYAKYTTGQRKGLGIALGKPAYVIDKNAETNTVTVSTDESELFTREIEIGNVYTPAFETAEEPFRVTAKIRYTPREAEATVYPREGNWRVVFDEPQRAPTKGQHCVFYENGVLLGGGEIC